MERELCLEETRKDLGRAGWLTKTLTQEGIRKRKLDGVNRRYGMSRPACPWDDGFRARGPCSSEGEGEDKTGKLVV